MNNKRYQKGIDKLMEFQDASNKEASNHLSILDSLKDVAPDITKYMVEFSYGEIYTREGLTNEQRVLITISSLVTQGMYPQLETHINAGLTIGVKPKEIVETLIHLLSYVGFPKVLNGIDVVKRVFEQRGIKLNTKDE